MFRYAILGLLIVAEGAQAQTPPQGESPQALSVPVPAPAQPAKPVSAMEEARPGDRWVYEVRDEITGTVTTTRTTVVTEVTPTEIAARFTNEGNPQPNRILFDRSWNVIEGGPWRYSPNDGSGVQLPLAVGKSWTFRSNDTNGENGAGWKRAGTSKVVGQETLTTKAGTFDTFRIETTSAAMSVKDPTRKTEVTATTWYAPAVNHWVKRSFELRANKRLMTNNVIEMVSYGRK